MTTLPPFSIEMIKKAVERELKDVVGVEFDKGIEALIVNARKQKEVVVMSCVLEIMQMAQFEMHQDNIVITIKKEK